MSNWTNEEMNLMVAKLVERKNRETATFGSRSVVVSDEQFFKQAGINYKKV
jgi:hypothetical protein